MHSKSAIKMKVGVEVKVIAFGVERQKHLLVELKLAKVLAVESERAHNVVVVAGLSAAVRPDEVADPCAHITGLARTLELVVEVERVRVRGKCGAVARGHVRAQLGQANKRVEPREGAICRDHGANGETINTRKGGEIAISLGACGDVDGRAFDPSGGVARAA